MSKKLLNVKTHVLSLGGSLIIPDDVDHEFIKSFINLILKRVKAGNRFIIVCGGGKLNKRYNEAAKKIRKMTSDELDWIGTYTTRFNAQFIRILFGNHLAYGKIATNPYEKFETKKPIIIGAGYKTGWSSDYDAVYLAKTYGAKMVINLSNIDYAYDKDPNRFEDAIPIKEISWKNFRKIVENRWKPRMNNPFDPIASKEAEKFGFRVVILNGKNLKNLENCLDGRKFMGTTIE